MTGVKSEESKAADRDLMLRFCSLGHNCEFGIAQRAFGAEPLDLLRWANTDYRILGRMLYDRFEGIGRDLSITRPPASGERMMRNGYYRFGWHAFAPPADDDETVVRTAAKRLPRLAEKLLDDIAEGHRVFVMWPTTPLDIDPTRVATVAAAAEIASLLAPARLLFVRDGAEVAHVEGCEGNLILGRIPVFASYPVNQTTRHADWLALCRATIDALVTSHDIALLQGAG